MNLFTKRMKLLTAVVLENATDEIVHQLLDLGVMDFIQVEQLSGKHQQFLSKRPSAVGRAEVSDLRKRVESIYIQAGTPVPGSEVLNLDTMVPLDMTAYIRSIDNLAGSLQTIKDRQKEISQKIITVEEMVHYARSEKTQYLQVHVGIMEHGTVDELRTRLTGLTSLVSGTGDTHDETIVVTLRRDAGRINPILDAFEWIESDDPQLHRNAMKRVLDALIEERTSLTAERNRLQQQVLEKIEKKKEQLDSMWGNLRMHELSMEVESYFSYTSHTTFFSGWVPEEQANRVESSIRAASKDKCIIEWTAASELPASEIPVSTTTPKAMKPFQKLVDNYGIPEYGSINPTPFVMISYLLMFGLMFADAGQGIVLALIGLLFRRIYRKHPEKEDGMITRNLSELLLYLGASSCVFGILFGSYFGYPLFPPLWFSYHDVVLGHAGSGAIQSIYDILGITIKFGICVIASGLLLNWINLFRKKRYFELLLDKNGVIGGWFFAVGVWAAFYFVGTGYKSLPPGIFLPIALGVPAIILLFKGVIHYRHELAHGGEKRKASSVILDTVMEWIVDLLEIFSGFLANTLSFMRVAGLGIAHVSLMSAFDQMSGIVGGGIFGILILIVGNLLVIALEGLSAGIQSLRLNYYEFFTKYFTGKGIAYEPITLKAKQPGK